MSDWAVVVAGIAAIVWVNWYFFLAKRTVGRASAAGGVQRVVITVRGGYEPAEVHVKRGAPVQLVFDRQETSSCSEEIVIPDQSIRRFLSPFAQTTVEFTPEKPGTFDMTCGMSMLHGKLVVED